MRKYPERVAVLSPKQGMVKLARAKSACRVVYPALGVLEAM